MKTVPIWLAAILVVASCFATAAALTIYSTQVERINIWGGQIQDTDFSITELSTKIKGKHRIDISITIKNEDATNVHSANVTIQLLDSNGDILVEQTVSTGDVAAGGTWSYTFNFHQTNLVSQYDSPFVIIRQTS